MIFSALAALLANPPGSLAYHFLLSTILGLLYVVGQAQHRGAGQVRAARWMLAAGWLFGLQMLILGGATANWLLLVQDATVLPALVHFVDFAAVLTFAWVLFFPQGNVAGDRALLAGIVINASLLAAAVVGSRMTLPNLGVEPGLVYLAWRTLSLALAIVAAVALVVRRSTQWAIAVAGLLTLALGHGLQLALTAGGDPLSGSTRVLSMLAYPLLAVAGLRVLTLESEQDEAGSQAPDLGPLEYTQSAEADMARALASLASAESDIQLAERAARAVAETMRSEYCLLLSSPDSKGNFSISTGYDLIREQYVPGAPLDDSRSPVLASALEKGRPLTLSDRSKSPDVYTLQSLLGLQSTGPGLLVPIANQGRIHGGLLLLSPYARRSWSDEQRATLEDIAGHLARGFERVKQRGAPASGEAYDALLDAQERIRQLERDNMRLFEALHAEGKLEVDALEVLDIDTLQASEVEETIAILEAEIERLQSAQPSRPELPTSEEMDQLKNDLQTALQELVSLRAEADELKARLAAESEAAPQAHGDMEAIAALAQELRQPMSSVMGYTDLLLGESVGLLGAMQKKFLERVRSAIERMGTLLNDLVQMTTLETGTLDLQPTRVDLLGCVEQAVGQAGPALRDKDQLLRMDFPDEVPAVLGDSEAISQIMSHLLRNAISASPEGAEIVLSAQVEGSPEDGFLMLSVRDSGEGIPPEELGRVFHRMHPNQQGMIQGLGHGGAGLSLVKGLSEALGGRVWVESEVDVGSTFTVLLPLAQTRSQAMSPPDPDQGSPGA